MKNEKRKLKLVEGSGSVSLLGAWETLRKMVDLQDVAPSLFSGQWTKVIFIFFFLFFFFYSSSTMFFSVILE